MRELHRPKRWEVIFSTLFAVLIVLVANMYVSAKTVQRQEERQARMQKAQAESRAEYMRMWVMLKEKK